MVGEHAPALENQAEGGGRRAVVREVARRHGGCNVRMGNCHRAGWAFVLLAAVAGVHYAESYQQSGYPCGLQNAGREGSHLAFSSGQTRLLHTGGNSTLYSSTFTVQLHAKLTDNRAFVAGSEVTLIGNMDSGRNTGWRVACAKGVCCLQGYLKQISQTMQQVCTHNEKGTPIAINQWFHITARYEERGKDVDGPRAKAAIFVNGIKHNEVEWGNPGRGEINYVLPRAGFAVGGGSTAGSTSTFVIGKMDEVRLWNMALTDAQVLDTSFEIAWLSALPCDSLDPYDTTNYNRIASVQDLSKLVLYIRNPGATTSRNLNIRGQPWINASGTSGVAFLTSGESGYIDREPILELLPTSKGVLADVYPRLGSAGAVSYNSSLVDDVTVVVSQHELTVLELRVRDPNYDDVVSVQRGLRFSDERLRAGNCFREGIGTDNLAMCNDEFGEGDMMGWHSFAGVAGYEGLHSEGSDVRNSITAEKLDADNLLESLQGDSRKGTPGDQMTQCRSMNTVADVEAPPHLRYPDFLPGYTDVQSRVHLRVVWAHHHGYGWWMPEEGYEYDIVVRSYNRYRMDLNNDGDGGTLCDAPASSSGKPGVCSKLKLGMHAHFSPEFINDKSYPKPSQSRPDQTIDQMTSWNSHAESLKAVHDGDSLAVAVGETLEFLIRVLDRNGEDVNVIKAREDPGLPPGHVIAEVAGKTAAYTAGLPTYPTRSKLLFPDSYTTTQAMAMGNTCPPPEADSCVFDCADKYRNRANAYIPPPSYVDRVFTYMPREQHAGAVFRVCLFAETQNAPAMGLRRYDGSARVSADLCVRIKVLVPAPRLVLPRGAHVFEAIIGCRLRIPLYLNDTSADGYVRGNNLAVVPYKYEVVSTIEGSRACSSRACGPIASPLIEGALQGLPRGMKIINDVAEGNGHASLEWIPERGQELDGGYRICVQGRAGRQVLPQYADLYQSPSPAECFEVRVRKCQECVRQGQSLASIARSLGADLLSLYMSNPFLERPEQIAPGTVISTGPLYEVREGDYLEALSNRFLVPVDDLKRSNPDVALGDGLLTPGLKMCVRAPVCAAKCKYGTDCHLPAANS